jgi:hypothetical protein
MTLLTKNYVDFFVAALTVKSEMDYSTKLEVIVSSAPETT